MENILYADYMAAVVSIMLGIYPMNKFVRTNISLVAKLLASGDDCYDQAVGKAFQTFLKWFVVI